MGKMKKPLADSSKSGKENKKTNKRRPRKCRFGKRKVKAKKAVALKKAASVMPAAVQIETTLPLNAEAIVPAQAPNDGLPVLRYSDIVKYSRLGYGAFGFVFLAGFRNEPLSRFALKIMSHASNKFRPEHARREFDLHQPLQHQNVTRVMGFIFENQESAILMEYCNNGCLLGYMLQENGQYLPKTPQRDRNYIRQVVTGVEYLHTVAKMIHMDIKPENVLLTSQEVVKITDFGISFKVQHQREVIEGDRGGTFIYKPPEFLTSPILFDSTTDVWAIGCMTFEMLDHTVSHPFYASRKFSAAAANKALQRAARFYMAQMRRGTYDYGNYKKWSSEIRAFLRQTIGTTRTNRPLISELLESAWLKENKKEEPIPCNVLRNKKANNKQ